MRALWSSRQNCSHNVSQIFKRIRGFSEPLQNSQVTSPQAYLRNADKLAGRQRLDLSGTGDSQRDSRKSIRANHSQLKPLFL